MISILATRAFRSGSLFSDSVFVFVFWRRHHTSTLTLALPPTPTSHQPINRMSLYITTFTGSQENIFLSLALLYLDYYYYYGLDLSLHHPTLFPYFIIIVLHPYQFFSSRCLPAFIRMYDGHRSVNSTLSSF